MVKMKIPNILPKLSFNLANIKDSMFTSLYEFKKTTKYEHSQKCNVIMIYPNSFAEIWSGLTDEANNFLFIPLLLRVYAPSNLNADDNGLHPIMLNGKKTFIVSSEYHGTLNLILLGKIASTIKHNINIKQKFDDKLVKFMGYYWKYHNNLIEFSFKDIPSVIDPHFLDNRYSVSWSNSSYLVLATKNLSFLEEVPRRVFILTMVVVGGIAFVIGMFISFIATSMLFIILALLKIV